MRERGRLASPEPRDGGAHGHRDHGDPDQDGLDDGSEELKPAVIQAFQIAQGLPVTGALDEGTVARLKEMHGC